MNTPTRRRLPLLVVLLVLLALKFAVGRVVEAPARPPLVTAAPVPLEELPLEEGAREAIGMQELLFGRVEGSHPPVWVYSGYHASQGHGSRVHAPEHCYPGQGFEIRGSTDAGPARELLVWREDARRLVWYSFATGVGEARSPWALKARQVVAALRGRPQDALLLRLSTPVEEPGGIAAARERLEASWGQWWPALHGWYEGTGSAR